MQSWHIVLIIGGFLYAAIVAANCLLTWHLVMSGRPAPSTKGRFFYCVAFGLQATLMLKLIQYLDAKRWHVGLVTLEALTVVFAVSYLSLVTHEWYGRVAGIAVIAVWLPLLASFLPAIFPPREAES